MQPPYSHLVKGSLLIASPEIESGIYFRGVLLLCEHSSAGSFALMINKRLEISLPEEIINLKESPNTNIHICAGGPMQPNQMMLLHAASQSKEPSMKICEGVYLGGDLPFLQEAAAQANGPALRICFGYGGWGPGQLEREFLLGHWFLHPATQKLVFETPLEFLWKASLREMGGKYVTLSVMPEDLDLN